ncbi:hypothetical protein JCM11251_005357 [Rhodosporidiobolus azoricus]
MVSAHPEDRAHPPQHVLLDLPPHAKKNFKILVLLNDTPIKAVKERYGSYHDIYTNLFRAAITLAGAEDSPPEDVSLVEGKHEATGERRQQLFTFTLESYDAVGQDLPDEKTIKEADGILLTGSASDAHGDDPWIKNLISFIQRVPEINPELKLIGMCFGHQIIARASGGHSERNSAGWELGTRVMHLTDVGKQVFPDKEKLSVHQMHRDHVPEVPDNFELLASTEDCKVHGLVRFVDPKKPFSLENIRILTLQGHPEFNSTIVNTVIDYREEQGVISKEEGDKHRERAGMHDDGDYVARRILGMFGV